MLRLFLKLYWEIFGWKISGQLPLNQPKMILAVGPHTHWHDVMTGFAARNAMQIHHARFLGKKELFKGLQGWVLKKLGGTPVDRFSPTGMVDQVVELFNTKERFILGLSPEGTRKRVDTLRTGFYHIAKKAGVPIVPIGLDYEHKKLVIGEAFFTGDDESTDFKKIIAFFANIKGKVPANDLRHLKTA